MINIVAQEGWGKKACDDAPLFWKLSGFVLPARTYDTGNFTPLFPHPGTGGTRQLFYNTFDSL